MAFQFCSLASGSSGNCYYIGNQGRGFLVDAGISTRRITVALKKMGINPSTLKGVLVTHNHSDHVMALDLLTRKYSLPVYTTHKVRESLRQHPAGKALTNDRFRLLEPFIPFSLAGIEIEAFTVSHDAPETVGFQLSQNGRRLTFANDLGHICETASRYLSRAHILVIEANYDEQMLAEGPYPYFLKARISGKKGHLSNSETADFLARTYNGQFSYIFLAHLSKHNNTPECALATLSEAFGPVTGVKPCMQVLSRSTPMPMMLLE